MREHRRAGRNGRGNRGRSASEQSLPVDETHTHEFRRNQHSRQTSPVRSPDNGARRAHQSDDDTADTADDPLASRSIVDDFRQFRSYFSNSRRNSPSIQEEIDQVATTRDKRGTSPARRPASTNAPSTPQAAQHQTARANLAETPNLLSGGLRRERSASSVGSQRTSSRGRRRHGAICPGLSATTPLLGRPSSSNRPDSRAATPLSRAQRRSRGLSTGSNRSSIVGDSPVQPSSGLASPAATRRPGNSQALLSPNRSPATSSPLRRAASTSGNIARDSAPSMYLGAPAYGSAVVAGRQTPVGSPIRTESARLSTASRISRAEREARIDVDRPPSRSGINRTGAGVRGAGPSTPGQQTEDSEFNFAALHDTKAMPVSRRQSNRASTPSRRAGRSRGGRNVAGDAPFGPPDVLTTPTDTRASIHRSSSRRGTGRGANVLSLSPDGSARKLARGHGAAPPGQGPGLQVRTDVATVNPPASEQAGGSGSSPPPPASPVIRALRSVRHAAHVGLFPDVHTLARRDGAVIDCRIYAAIAGLFFGLILPGILMLTVFADRMNRSGLAAIRAIVAIFSVVLVVVIVRAAVTFIWATMLRRQRKHVQRNGSLTGASTPRRSLDVGYTGGGDNASEEEQDETAIRPQDSGRRWVGMRFRPAASPTDVGRPELRPETWGHRRVRTPSAAAGRDRAPDSERGNSIVSPSALTVATASSEEADESDGPVSPTAGRAQSGRAARHIRARASSSRSIQHRRSRSTSLSRGRGSARVRPNTAGSVSSSGQQDGVDWWTIPGQMDPATSQRADFPSQSRSNTFHPIDTHPTVSTTSGNTPRLVAPSPERSVFVEVDHPSAAPRAPPGRPQLSIAIPADNEPDHTASAEDDYGIDHTAGSAPSPPRPVPELSIHAARPYSVDSRESGGSGATAEALTSLSGQGGLDLDLEIDTRLSNAAGAASPLSSLASNCRMGTSSLHPVHEHRPLTGRAPVEADIWQRHTARTGSSASHDSYHEDSASSGEDSVGDLGWQDGSHGLGHDEVRSLAAAGLLGELNSLGQHRHHHHGGGRWGRGEAQEGGGILRSMSAAGRGAPSTPLARVGGMARRMARRFTAESNQILGSLRRRPYTPKRPTTSSGLPVDALRGFSVEDTSGGAYGYRPSNTPAAAHADDDEDMCSVCCEALSAPAGTYLASECLTCSMTVS